MFELSFLNAGLLVFAAATVLPLLIWLLAKKKPPQLIFSSLRFLKISSEEEKSRTRITNIILLIIRMLIVLLVALAVARPMLSSSLFGRSEKHPPTAVAIILDNSYSMDYIEERQSRLDKALQAVSVINERSREGDRLIPISRDRQWNDLHAQIYASGIPTDILQSLKPGWERLDWDETFVLAEAKLAEAQMPNSEIYLLSDLVNEDLSFQSSHPVAAIPVSEKDPRQNISVSQARPLPQIVQRGRRQSIEFRLTNHGSQDRTEVLVQAVLDDIKVAERFFSIPARQSAKETISFDIRADGWQSGYIEVLDGYLTADNRSYFAFEYTQNPRVAVISTRSLPTHLASILRVYGGGRQADLIDPSRVNLQMADDYGLFIFYESGELSPRLREMIAHLDERGIGSLFIPGKVLPTELKGFLQSRFRVNLGDYQPGSIKIDFISPHHHASALIADKDLRFDGITGYWSSSGAALAMISAKENALALSAKGSALWLWDPAGGSEFFSDPAFAVFGYRSLNTLQSGQVPASELKVGDVIPASEIRLPSGDQISLAIPQYITREPGIYQPITQSADPPKIAVNIDYYDSEPDQSELPRGVRLLSEDFADEIFMSRLGRDLWKILLTLALALIILEIAIVKSREYKSRHRSET